MNTNKFIIKLTEMMKQFPEIINWSADGKEMEIFNIQRFQAQVYANYFTTSNYKSFVRQLNMYNFRRISKRKNSASFKHPHFQRGNQTSFQNIRRRQQKTKTRKNQMDKEIDLYIDEGYPSSLSTSTVGVDIEIHQILGQIKRQISQKGAYLVQHLEGLLFKGIISGPILCQNGSDRMPQSKSMSSIRQCASLSRIEAVLKERSPFCLNSSFELNQSNVFDSNLQSEL